MASREVRKYFWFVARSSILLLAFVVSLFAQSRNPVILIPGITGSELKDKTTGESIWFRAIRSKSADLRLPISSDISKNHDNLVPGDVLRKVKVGIFPITDVYDSVIKALEVRGGYHEESWTEPPVKGLENSLFVFAYDWRLDNVENARRLVRQVEALKKKLKRPDQKFDIVAHSMGGIIARYALMYGDADLPTGSRKTVPTWAGAKDFDKIALLGTPNEGSVLALGTFLNGFSIGGLRIDLPFLQDTSRFTVFTMPAAYQLLPAPGTFRVLNDDLEPVAIDLYDPKAWAKYGWSPIKDEGFSKEFDAAQRKAAPAYLAMVLDRAKRLHEALDAAPGKTGGAVFYIVGADCKTSPDSIIVYPNENGNKWRTLIRPKGFKGNNGRKITDEELKSVMYLPGDGVVTSRSLEAMSESEKTGIGSIFKSGPTKFVCDEHYKLAANTQIQDYLIGILEGPKAKEVTGGIVH